MVESISSPSASSSASEAIAFCAADLRRYDPDRYFTSLLAGGEEYHALVPLYAFNLEIARIREIVSEPMLGQIRLQWWRDAIGEIYAGTPRNHPVVTALTSVIERFKPTRSRFEAMLDGRELDLEEQPPATMRDLTVYARATSGELSCLALEILGARDDDSMKVGNDAGVAWALTGLIKAVPFHAAQGRSFMPGVTGQKIQQNPNADAIIQVVEQIAAVAFGADTDFRETARAVPKKARTAILHNVLVQPELRLMEKARFDPFASKQLTPAGRRLRMIWSSMTGRF